MCGEDPATRVLSREFESGFSVRWIFHRENLGLAAARNTGAGAARGDNLLFLDDDVEPATDLISEHEAALNSLPAWPAYVVCGRIVEERTAPFRSKTDKFMQRAWEQSLQHALPGDGAPNLLSVGAGAERGAWFGLNCSIKRELFELLGGFDPRMRSDEEMEFGLNLPWRSYDAVRAECYRAASWLERHERVLLVLLAIERRIGCASRGRTG